MILGKNPAHFHLMPPIVAAVVAAAAVAVAAAPLAIEKSPPMRGAKNIMFCTFFFVRTPCPDINYKSLQSDISGCANNFPYRIEHLLHSRLTR